MPCFCTFSGPSLLEMKFCRSFSHNFCFFLLGFLNQVPNRTRFNIVSATHLRIRYHTTDQTNTFIASDEIVSAIHLCIQYHTADKRFYRWQWMHFVLEMNILVLKMNTLKKRIWTSFSHTHTNTASYQRLPNRTYSTPRWLLLTRFHMLTWLLFTPTHLWKWAVIRCGYKKKGSSPLH